MSHAPGTDRPAISVIITSYNYAHYLSSSIGSVLAQDFPSFELVVVDNASTDNTDEVVATFANDPRLRYIKNERNIGLTPNHNNGLRHSRGEHILFLSADDMLLPGHLRRCYDYLQGHPETDVFYTGVIFIDANGTAFGVRGMGGQLPVDHDGGRNEFAAQLAEGCYIPYPAMLIRRSLYDELGPMDESFTAADYEITTRWAAAGKRFAYTRVPSCAIRLHGPQASGTTYVESGTDIREYLAILERHVTPANEHLLRGRIASVVGHLRWRAEFFRQSQGTALPDDIARRVETMAARIGAIPQPRPAFDDRPLIAVILRVGTLLQLQRSLNSLAAQADGMAWEAVVIGEGGPDYGPLLASMPYRDNVRFVRMDERNPSAARNTGFRVTSAPIVTYMEPGTVFAPDHFGNLAQAFAGGPAVVRTGGTVMLCETKDGSANTTIRETKLLGLLREDADEERDFVAPSIPIDTIAHTRAALEAIGPFRADILYGETWEFWLRLRTHGAVYLPWQTVELRYLRQHVMPDANAFLNIARGLYSAYVPPPESPLVRRRIEYLAAMTTYFERGAAALADDNAAAQFLGVLMGVVPAAVAAPV